MRQCLSCSNSCCITTALLNQCLIGLMVIMISDYDFIGRVRMRENKMMPTLVISHDLVSWETILCESALRIGSRQERVWIKPPEQFSESLELMPSLIFKKIILLDWCAQSSIHRQVHIFRRKQQTLQKINVLICLLLISTLAFKTGDRLFVRKDQVTTL